MKGFDTEIVLKNGRYAKIIDKMYKCDECNMDIYLGISCGKIVKINKDKTEVHTVECLKEKRKQKEDFERGYQEPALFLE